mgnify:CR=1 FL=1
MKHYRSYMDRITAPARLRQRVLEAAEQGARPRRPARRLTLRLAALFGACGSVARMLLAVLASVCAVAVVCVAMVLLVKGSLA